ncbi:UNVERIFIED_CONTAM: L-ascorbate oxidase [Sesamum calycinum]|uniref:L-ascorbate oxidase n=1 Tax=Sesamum calycinum TaxID=2727403 RepID=A0AAW2LUW1_9LAMI
MSTSSDGSEFTFTDDSCCDELGMGSNKERIRGKMVFWELIVQSPNSNYTYKFQTKDQIGSYTYFPSTGMHRAAGGFGALNIYARSGIATNTGFRKTLPFPNGLLMHSHDGPSFTGDQGKTYMLRISNIGLSISCNFRIQDHKLKLVEVEGSHVLQNIYDSLDIHVGQSVTVLVTLDQPVKDYYIAVDGRFSAIFYGATAVVYYNNSGTPVHPPVPDGPPNEVDGPSIKLDHSSMYLEDLNET